MSAATVPDRLFALRPYQQSLKDEIYDGLRSKKKKLVAQLSTGGGKTILFSDIARDGVINNKRVLILAHRNELITQAADKFTKSTSLVAGIVKAGYKPHPERLVQIGSVQTIYSRLDKYNSNFFDFDLIIVDECHRSISKSYLDILARCNNPAILGFTATPIRSDGKGLGDLYEGMCNGIPTADLMEIGALSRYKIFEGSNNDVDPYHPKNALRAYRDHADGKQTIVFCNDVQHSIEVARAYTEAGYAAVHLDSSTPSSAQNNVRDQAIKDFASKKIQILCNYGLFIEGLDVPNIEVVQLLRACGSIANYLQILGRGLRPALGKTAIFLIHSDSHHIHGLPDDPRVWTLDGVQRKEKTTTVVVKKPEDWNDPEPEPVSQLCLDTILREFPQNRDMSVAYITEIKRLINQYAKMNKSPGWIYDLVIKLKPTPAGWHYYAKSCGMPPRWADRVIEGLATGQLYSVPPPKTTLKKIWQAYNR